MPGNLEKGARDGAKRTCLDPYPRQDDGNGVLGEFLRARPRLRSEGAWILGHAD